MLDNERDDRERNLIGDVDCTGSDSSDFNFGSWPFLFLQSPVQRSVLMKGITETGWVLLLAIIGGIIAFIIILSFTTDFSKKLIDMINNFKLSDMMELWKKVLKGGN